MKIISQNFCLGLPNKIDMAIKWITHHKPNVFIIQEAEITHSTNQNLLEIKNYQFTSTLNENKPKARLAIYTLSEDNFKIECCTNSETIHISSSREDIFAVYRPFKTLLTTSEYINIIISFIKSRISSNKEIIIVGDFNLDYSRRNDPNYSNFSALQAWLTYMDEINLAQRIHNITWERVVNNKTISSILDHSYTSNDEYQSTVIDLLIGDYKGILICDKQTTTSQNRTNKSYRRIWSKYSPEALKNLIDSDYLTSLDDLDVETHNLLLTQHLMTALDKVAPIVLIKSDESKFAWSEKLIRLRRKKSNLLKKMRKTKDPNLLKRCRMLDKQFRKTITSEKRKKVMNLCQNHSGTQQSFWKAVNLATNKQTQS